MGTLLYADAIHIREQAKIDAARITQKSRNELSGATTAMSNFASSLSNMRAMKAAGAAMADQEGNLARRLSDASTGPMRMRLAAAEELGAMAAMAGAAGVGGGAVEQYNETVRLTTAMNEEGFTRSVEADNWAASQAIGNTMVNAVGGLDNNIYRANLDYTQYVDHKKPSWFEQVVGVGLTAAATVFGGPQAGAAVMGVFESRQAARNGDFAGASNSLTSAFTNGMGAVQTASSLRRPASNNEGTPPPGPTREQAAKSLPPPDWGTPPPSARSIFSIGTAMGGQHLNSITIR